MATATTSSNTKPLLVQWILDTRTWWPEATETRLLETHASRTLALLTEAERAGVLRYYHVRDAKMAAASALLKHYAVARLAGATWPEAAVMTRDARTKPVWRHPATGAEPVAFNVSHQAGIVALVAVARWPGPGPVDVGVDVVCTSERRDRDLQLLLREPAHGWPRFVDMHADVFAPGEAAYLKYQTPSPAAAAAAAALITPEHVADARLRAFYALWALREAYVKLTGDALLAAWLRELEFRAFRAPRPTPAWTVPAREDGAGDSDSDDAQVINSIDIRFRGKKVDDVNISLRSMGPDFMICTAVRTPETKATALGWRLGPYEILALDEVLSFAESADT
ncbi:hypothetical protein B0T24DRAFT_52558 [Lasiosphaeria ovina]|uniref:holo-[acyl-carrier-protein] synthase n=1 Tax=Lasiosphaeria ovina TaxID=92902 RepID=A0AAE0TXS7_9PEZI|nr:hypothetical protein B0T24DRAFT_52558 [Lasiosphaeria ovina]